MKYQDFFKTMQADIIETYDSLLTDAPEESEEWLKKKAEAEKATTLSELVECFCNAGWCRQDIVGYLLYTLIDDAVDPAVRTQLEPFEVWDPAMAMDS